MSCACEHKKLSSEYERMKRLAKACARLQEQTVGLYKNPDDTYAFCVVTETSDKQFLEYLSPY